MCLMRLPGQGWKCHVCQGIKEIPLKLGGELSHTPWSNVLQVSNVATGHVGSFWKPDPVPHHYEHRLAYDEVPPGSHQLCCLDDDNGQDDRNDCDDHDDRNYKDYRNNWQNISTMTKSHHGGNLSAMIIEWESVTKAHHWWWWRTSTFDWSNQNLIWPSLNGYLKRRCIYTKWLSSARNAQHWLLADMLFVKKFTPPDFQAKTFTP